MNNITKHYCAYLRKSRMDVEAEARGEGETLRRHANILKDLAERMHIQIEKEFREIVSGENISSRPEMQNLLHEVEDGMWDGVLVVEIERLARGNSVDQGIVAQTFKLSDTKIITPTKTYDPNNEFDEEYFEFGLFMSRREYKTIKRRLMAGRLSSVKEGKYVGSVAPYGWRRVKLVGEKGFTLEHHEAEVPVVRHIFNLFVEKNIGHTNIANILNQEGVQSRSGKIWTASMIRNILENPVHIGLLRWNRRPERKKSVNGVIKKTRPKVYESKLFKANIDPIIPEETYWRADEKMRQHRVVPLPARIPASSNPFAGLITCKQCGHSIVLKRYISKTKTKYNTLLCPRTECNCVSASFTQVEHVILETLRSWMDGYTLEYEPNEALPLNASYYISSIEKLEMEITNLKEQLNRCHTLLEQDVYDIDTFVTRSTTIKNDLAQKGKALANVKHDYNEAISESDYKLFLVPKISFLLENYGSMSPNDKNILLKELIERITYNKTSRNKRGDTDTIKFELEIFPRIPKKRWF